MTALTQLTPGVLRTPRAAGLAGILFAVLLGTALALIRAAIPANPNDAGTWLSDPSRRGAVRTGLNLIPFAGISFLWFMGAVRARVGGAEDKFFSMLFVGSGLVFLVLLFVVSAMLGTLISLAGKNGGHPPIEAWQFGRGTTFDLVTIYALRMAAVFTISMSVIGLRLGILHRRLAQLGFLVGLVLLLAAYVPWLELVLPVWIAVVSIDMLIVARRARVPLRADDAAEPQVGG